MMHVTDDLLRLSTATVPLVASAVTGMFLFVNRGGRRIERLRTLVEIHASLPGHLNPNYAVQRAILWQLAEVQLWATPWFRLVKLYLYVMGGLFLLLFAVGTFPNTLGIHHDIAAIFAPSTVVASIGMVARPAAGWPTPARPRRSVSMLRCARGGR
jgi:hypothetical protein